MVNLGKIKGFQVFSIFYLVTGISLLAMLLQTSSVLVHVGLLGALSLIVSYGLIAMKKWAFFLTAFISLLGISFGCVTVYAIYKILSPGWIETVSLLAMILYVMISVISLLYTIHKKDEFK